MKPETLRLVIHDNAQSLALFGLHNPYAGKLGMFEVGALCATNLLCWSYHLTITSTQCPGIASNFGI